MTWDFSNFNDSVRKHRSPENGLRCYNTAKVGFASAKIRKSLQLARARTMAERLCLARLCRAAIGRAWIVCEGREPRSGCRALPSERSEEGCAGQTHAVNACEGTPYLEAWGTARETQGRARDRAHSAHAAAAERETGTEDARGPQRTQATSATSKQRTRAPAALVRAPRETARSATLERD